MVNLQLWEFDSLNIFQQMGFGWFWTFRLWGFTKTWMRHCEARHRQNVHLTLQRLRIAYLAHKHSKVKSNAYEMQFLSSNFIVLFSEQLKNGMLPTPTFWNDMTRGDQLKQKAWVAQSMNDWTHIRTIMENLHHTWHLSDGVNESW